MVPRAVGAASRLKQEAEAYKARVVAQAQGDAQRFRSVYAEYQKAPQVTRDRMYLDAMQEIYGNVTKVIGGVKTRLQSAVFALGQGSAGRWRRCRFPARSSTGGCGTCFAPGHHHFQRRAQP